MTGTTGSSGSSCLNAGASCTAQSNCCTGLTCQVGYCLPATSIPDAGTSPLPDVSQYDAIVGDMLPFDGGGTVLSSGMTFTVSYDAGAMTITAMEGGQLALVLVYLHGDDTAVTGTGYDLHGNVNYQYASNYDGVGNYISESQSDTHATGAFDRQDQWMVSIDGGLPYAKTETVWAYQLPDGGPATADAGGWVQLWASSGPGSADANEAARLLHKPRACNGYVGFPANPSDTSQYIQVAIPKTNWAILESTPGNDGNGGCSSDFITTLSYDIELALMDATQCFDVINRNQKVKLELGKSRRLLIGCGNTCGGTAGANILASTDLPTSQFATENGFLRMNLYVPAPGAGLAGWGDPGIEEILLHEAIHASGTDHNPPGKGYPDGHDLVYGCGRYCTRHCGAPGSTEGWGQAAVGALQPQMYAFDGTDCAEDQSKDSIGLLYDIDTCDNAAWRTGARRSVQPSATCCAIPEGLRCYADQAGGITRDEQGDRDPVYHGANVYRFCVQSGGTQGRNDWPWSGACRVRGWAVQPAATTTAARCPWARSYSLVIEQ